MAVRCEELQGLSIGPSFARVWSVGDMLGNKIRTI
jgi:hypothetical protein